MANSIRPLNVNSEPRGCTFQSGAKRWDTSVHTLKRAASHDMIATIQIGDRSIIPPAEVTRIDREGLGRIPPGYKRKTTGHWPGGRKAKTADTTPTKTKPKPKTLKAAGKAPSRRSKRSEERITT